MPESLKGRFLLKVGDNITNEDWRKMIQAHVGKEGAVVRAVHACELGGNAPGAAVEQTVADGWLSFKHDGKAACYRVDL